MQTAGRMTQPEWKSRATKMCWQLWMCDQYKTESERDRKRMERVLKKKKAHAHHGEGEWKMIAVTDVWWKIGYYTSWETNSFFYGEIKTLIHLNHQGLLGWPRSFTAQVRRTPGGLPCHPSTQFIMLGVRPLFSRGTLGNFVDQNVALSTEPFVIYCTLSSFPHPDTHTIYEDNCKARRAPTEPSLMDRKPEMGERCKKWEREKHAGRSRKETVSSETWWKVYVSLPRWISIFQERRTWVYDQGHSDKRGYMVFSFPLQVEKKHENSEDFDSLCEREWQSNAWMCVCTCVGG